MVLSQVLQPPALQASSPRPEARPATPALQASGPRPATEPAVWQFPSRPLKNSLRRSSQSHA